jgi:hypothetical protein
MKDRAVGHLKLATGACLFGALAMVAAIASTSSASQFFDGIPLGSLGWLAYVVVALVLFGVVVIASAIGVAVWSICYSRHMSLCEREEVFLRTYRKGSWARIGLALVRLSER